MRHASIHSESGRPAVPMLARWTASCPRHLPGSGCMEAHPNMDERNTRPPSFQFYPRDFMSDPAVLQMGLAARGAYINLLCVSWMSDQPGILPSDDEALARLSLAGSEWPAVADAVRRAFKVKGTNLVQSRMVSEREAQRQRHERASAGGRATAEKRWGSVAQQPLENSNAVTPASASASASAENLSQTLLSDVPSDGRANGCAKVNGTPPRPRSDPYREHPLFPRWYDAYPRHVHRRDASRAFNAALKRATALGVAPELFAELSEDFAAEMREAGRPEDKIPHPSRWLNADGWREHLTGLEDKP